MAFETYKESTKYSLELRFETVEDASVWVSEADTEVTCGEQRRHAESWVDMYFDSEDDLNNFVLLAIGWQSCWYFEVQKRRK